MRNDIAEQLKIGEVDPASVKIDLRARDEIPKTLLGLQKIYKTPELINEILSIMKEIIDPKVDQNNGRPGMTFWKILVLGVIRLICNIDYDKLLELANQHMTLREMLGHSIYNRDHYSLQTLKDNLMLFTPDVLDRINQAVVKFGHDNCDNSSVSKKLYAKCDSFPVATDVHFPTDINLLFDSIRKIIELSMKFNLDHEVQGWRQGKHLLKTCKRFYRIAQKIKASTSKDERKKRERQDLIKKVYKDYLDFAITIVTKAKAITQEIKLKTATDYATIESIFIFIRHAERQIDQTKRRVLEGEKILHDEKVFSLFEEHTEWLSKGKAGVPQVLGLNVCIVVDQHGFILNHQVMEDVTDSGIAVGIIKSTIEKFRDLVSCSFDKGFHSPDNQKELAEVLENVYMSCKGKLSKSRAAIEYSEDFKEAKRKHSSVEASIASLINHGLDMCPDHGIHGFKRYVGLAILAHNIHHIGKIEQKKRLEELPPAKRSIIIKNEKAS